MAARGVLRIIEGGRLGFWCPGCKEMHVVGAGWEFNGDYDRPKFTPSILVRGYRVSAEGKAMIARGESPPAGQRYPGSEVVCHSFVAGGRIQFLSDCTHALADQTVDLQPCPR